MREAARAWFEARTSHHQDYPLPDLLAAKAAGDHRISVVIPARDEEIGVGGVVAGIRAELMTAAPLVDEIVVIDSDSRDGTAAVAIAAGARVHASATIRPDLGSYPGKGEALWKSTFVTTGDLLVFVDADLTLWGPHFVTGLLGPLLTEPAIELVKGFYDRILSRDGEAPTPDGGRVTELVARPLLDLWWPDLATVVQPLAGEWAIRRSWFEQLSVPTGYGVEIASLIDTYAERGLGAIAQVDLGARAHFHQHDHDLAVMAAEILAVTRARFPAADGGPAADAVRTDAAEPWLHQYRRTGPGQASSPGDNWRSRAVPLTQRPPARQV